MNWLDLLLGPALMALLFLAWLAVAHLWRRAFELPAETDVLAERGGCATCSGLEACQSRHGIIALEEEHHG